jgi:hypothetical protein
VGIVLGPLSRPLISRRRAEAMSKRRLPPRAIAAWLATGLLLAGCGLGSLRDVSYSDRCAELMKSSFPGGNIEVTKQNAAIDQSGGNISTMLVTVEGTRKDVPASGFVARDVAVECRFDDGVLTSFRWTTGPFR